MLFRSEIAAVREVEEETGVDQLEIIRPLKTTFYIYTEKGRRKLKKTHWYLMRTHSNERPEPQIEEDIEEVRWMSRAEIESTVMKNTYVTIAGLLSEE